MKELKTILVDDHAILMEGVETLLEDANGVVVQEKFSNGKLAKDYLDEHQIDLVITDIHMPEMDGLQLTKWIKEEMPDTKVIVLSMHDEDQYVHDIILADAEGYVLKGNTSEELVNAVNRVADDGIYYSDQIVKKLRKGFQALNNKVDVLHQLSEREIEILRLIVNELTTQEIADELYISRHTVESHKKNLYKKTMQNNLVGLVKFAISNQLITL